MSPARSAPARPRILTSWPTHPPVCRMVWCVVCAGVCCRSWLTRLLCCRLTSSGTSLATCRATRSRCCWRQCPTSAWLKQWTAARYGWVHGAVPACAFAVAECLVVWEKLSGPLTQDDSQGRACMPPQPLSAPVTVLKQLHQPAAPSPLGCFDACHPLCSWPTASTVLLRAVVGSSRCQCWSRSIPQGRTPNTAVNHTRWAGGDRGPGVEGRGGGCIVCMSSLQPAAARVCLACGHLLSFALVARGTIQERKGGALI